MYEIDTTNDSISLNSLINMYNEENVNTTKSTNIDTDFYINKMIGGETNLDNLTEIIENLSDVSSDYSENSYEDQLGGADDTLSDSQSYLESDSESNSLTELDSDSSYTESSVQQGGNKDSELSAILRELSESNNQLGGNNSNISNTDSELLELLNNLEYK